MNITYLLGAGASANCLPVINELPFRLNNLVDEINNRRNQNSNNAQYRFEPSPELLKQADVFVTDLLEIIKGCKQHNTIDTLAKKYYLTGNEEELYRLKKVMITYFMYEQSFVGGDIRKGIKKELPDKRYDSFIATIISSKIRDLSLPSSFNIITWNYDYQFELAYQEYLDNDFLKAKASINSIPSEHNQTYTVDTNQFNIVRLNGLAGLHKYEYNKIDIEEPYGYPNLKDFYSSVVKYYHRLTREDLLMFNYSWEDPNESSLAHSQLRTVKDAALEIMKRTDILVVIGYSFPLFNRSVDKQLIESLPVGCHKIYIQDTPDRISAVKSLLEDSFQNLNPVYSKHVSRRMITVDYTGQFFIPPDADI
jgi:hypothetical protein